VDVVNAGVSGINSDKRVLKLADYLLLEPDMIVVYNAANDICHGLFPKWVSETSASGRVVRSLRALDKRLNPLTLPGEAAQRRDIRAKMANLAFLCDQADRVRGGKEVFGDIFHMKNRGIERKARAIAEMLLPLLPEGLSADAAPQTPSSGSPGN